MAVQVYKMYKHIYLNLNIINLHSIGLNQSTNHLKIIVEKLVEKIAYHLTKIDENKTNIMLH